MAYAIAKPGTYGTRLYVTAIKRGGLSIDNTRFDPFAKFDARCLARKWKKLESAQKALQALHDIGGFFDYQIEEL